MGSGTHRARLGGRKRAANVVILRRLSTTVGERAMPGLAAPSAPSPSVRQGPPVAKRGTWPGTRTHTPSPAGGTGRPGGRPQEPAMRASPASNWPCSWAIKEKDNATWSSTPWTPCWTKDESKSGKKGRYIRAPKNAMRPRAPSTSSPAGVAMCGLEGDRQGAEDVFIHGSDVGMALHGDRVEIRIGGRSW